MSRAKSLSSTTRLFDELSRRGTWSQATIAALLFGYDPRVFDYDYLRQTCDRRGMAEYRHVVGIISRARQAGELPYTMTPSEVVKWAKRVGWVLPAGLIEQVERVAGAKAKEGLSESPKETISTARCNAGAGATDSENVRTRERSSMLKLIIGMAMQGYRYDPSRRRSDKVPEIVRDLDQLGIPLDPGTVRKYLQEAAELLPPRQDSVS